MPTLATLPRTTRGGLASPRALTPLRSGGRSTVGGGGRGGGAGAVGVRLEVAQRRKRTRGYGKEGGER